MMREFGKGLFLGPPFRAKRINLTKQLTMYIIILVVDVVVELKMRGADTGTAQ